MGVKRAPTLKEINWGQTPISSLTPTLSHKWEREWTAAAVARGEVVGWFQGRMEWGPRVLGNRSIVGDPRRADMKDILNLKIKRPCPFVPFLPPLRPLCAAKCGG